jgi:hypothetical protein
MRRCKNLLTIAVAGTGCVAGPADVDPRLEDGQPEFCEVVDASTCPGDDDAQLTAHAGLKEVFRCQYELEQQDLAVAQGPAIDALAEELPIVSVSELVAAADHAGAPIPTTDPHLAGLDRPTRAFRWDQEDFDDAAWMPQGVTGSADATAAGLIDGRELVAVSWYHKPENEPAGTPNHGSRVSFADITDLGHGAVRYAHVLLVDVVMKNGEPVLEPITLHVGGLAWVGNRLYAVDTMRGLRVFDTSKIMKVEVGSGLGRNESTGDWNARGYQWIMPQVEAYLLSDESCWHRFSFVALDQTSNPPSLVTGEYHGNDIAGKLVRWDLDGEALVTDELSGKIYPREVFHAQESRMQGAVSVGGHWYLSCSRQTSGGEGRLYRTSLAEPSTGRGWTVGPEDLMYAGRTHELWSASEFAGRRYVFAVQADG